MKNKSLAVLITMSSLLPLTLTAQQHDHQAAGGGQMHCEMMSNMTGMQTELQAMIKETSDPAMKARLQKMDDQMQSMMSHMHEMHKAGDGSMQCGHSGSGGGMNMEQKGMNHEGMNHGGMNHEAAPAQPAAEHKHTP